jgi:hypothetical protein
MKFIRNSPVVHLLLIGFAALAFGLGVRFTYEELLHGGESPGSLSTMFADLARKHIEAVQTELLNTPVEGKPINLTPPNILMYSCRRYADTKYTTTDGVEFKVRDATIENLKRTNAVITETIVWDHWGIHYTFSNKIEARIADAKWSVESMDYSTSAGL